MLQIINGIDTTIDVAETVLDLTTRAIASLVWLVVFTVAFLVLLTIALLTDHEPTMTDTAFQPSPIATVSTSIGKTQPKKTPKRTRKPTTK